MSKLYFKKNGKGYVTSTTITIPMHIARAYKGKELEIKDTKDGILIKKKDKNNLTIVDK